MDHGDHHSIACLSNKLFLTSPKKKMKESLLWCEWYQYVPAWSGTVKSYRNEFSGIIGHWETPTGPSAKLVLCWNIPCQCYNCVWWWENRLWLIIPPTYNTRASKHSRVRQSVNHIQLKTIALKFVRDEFDWWTSWKFCSTYLFACDRWSRESPTILRGTCKNSTGKKGLDMKL